MFIQVEKPNKGDPFFNNAAGGGISTAITAAGAADGLNVLPNCVGGAVGAYNKAACKDVNKPEFRYLSHPPNAENIMERAKQEGLPVSQKPAVGALVVWQKGATLSGSDGAGHVGVVEFVNASGSIVTSESGWNAKTEFWTTTRRNDGNWGQSSAYRFIGFILPPSPVVRAIKKGDNGDDVRQLQTALTDAGYDLGKIDGDFGIKTQRAVVCFQFEQSLEVDGICGPKTRAALGL